MSAVVSMKQLGRGWSLPLIPGEGDRALPWAEGGDKVQQSIYIILDTEPGERVMRPDFGCAAHDLIFAPNNSNTHGLIVHYVKEALTKWEPRIQELEVHAGTDPEELNRLDVGIQYQVIATNNVYNLVYPFYLQKSP